MSWTFDEVSLALRLSHPSVRSFSLVPFPIVTRTIALHSAVNIAPTLENTRAAGKDAIDLPRDANLVSLAVRLQRN